MSDPVVVRQGDLGRGVYAGRPLRAGERILRFDGPVLTHAHVLTFGEAQAYALQIGPDEYIDTLAPGRFTNHSCQPNAGVIENRVLLALRPIARGEEVRFDYSTTMSENHWTMACRCGAKTCRGVIRDFHLLPPELQFRYIGLGIVQQFIAQEWETRRTGIGPRPRLREA